jgi:hypothetical protein
MTIEEIKSYLCYYDTRNPDGILSNIKWSPEIYDEEEISKLGEFSKEGCACDNCFYRRHDLANYILENCK